MNEETRKHMLKLWNDALKIADSNMQIVVCDRMPTDDYFSITYNTSNLVSFNGFKLSREGFLLLERVMIDNFGDVYELCANVDYSIFWCMKNG